MFRLIPTKAQWNGWSLPSKLACISTYLSAFAILLAIVFFVFGPTKYNQKEILRQLADIQKRLPENIPPIMTKEDAERPLSAKEKELLAKYEKWKSIAEQANIKTQFNLNVQISYAGTLLRLGQYREAESAYRTICVGHPDNTLTMAGLGITLLELAKYQEAEEILKGALAIDQASDPNSVDVARDLNNLAALYQATNRLKEAEALMERALKIDEKSLGKDHPNVAIRLNNLAQLYQATNRLKEAEPLMERALKINEKSFGKDNPNVARDLNNLAGLYQATNRLKEAEPLMERHLVIFLNFTRRTGHRHPHLADAINNYCNLLMEMGHSKEEVIAKLKQLGPEMFE